MPFPPSDRIVFSKRILDQVICQLRFPTILNIGAADPAGFQERIRHEYPNFSVEAPMSGLPQPIADLIAQVGDSSQLKLISGPVYKFESENRKRFISLTREWVAVTDHEYRNWHDFLHEVERARTALEAEYEPAFYSRVGLRYIDVIDRARLGLINVPWTELINPALLGLLGDMAVTEDVRDSKTETQMVVQGAAGGQMTLRHGLMRTNSRDVYQLDVDLYTNEKVECDDSANILVHFNTVAGHFIRWALQPRLVEALGIVSA
jgi:uncharacterized protein (TIGR04255 family)